MPSDFTLPIAMKSIFDLTYMYQNFYELINVLFVQMDIFNFHAWFTLIAYYIAPALLIYFIVKGFLEEVGLFNRYTNGLSIVITLISLPPGVYVVSWLVANSIALGVLALFGSLALLSIGGYYRRKMRDFNYLLGSEFLTNLLAHLPLILFMGLVGGFSYVYVVKPLELGVSVISIIFGFFLPLVVGVGFIIRGIYVNYVRNSGSFSYFDLDLIFHIVLGLILIILAVVDPGDYIIGFNIGSSLGLMLSLMNHALVNPMKYIDLSTQAKEKIEELLSMTYLAKRGIEQLLNCRDEVDRKRVYASFDADVKTALRMYGITEKSLKSKDVLKNTYKDINDRIVDLEARLNDITEKAFNKFMEEI